MVAEVAALHISGSGCPCGRCPEPRALLGVSGGIGFQVIRKDAWVPDELKHVLQGFNPKTELGLLIRDCLKFLPVTQAAELIDRMSSVVVLQSALSLRVLRGCEGRGYQAVNGTGGGWLPHKAGTPQGTLPNCYACGLPREKWVEDYGEVGHKVITTAGVNFLVDAWQGTVEMEILKFHGLGTGSTAEAIGDTALVTELTTEYTGNVRATGTLTEGASANIFRTVGSNLLDGTPGAALREHGIFSASSAGTLWDRTVFAAITLSSGDTLESTYDCTASAGG